MKARLQRHKQRAETGSLLTTDIVLPKIGTLKGELRVIHRGQIFAGRNKFPTRKPNLKNYPQLKKSRKGK